uniref:Uncharacterized protein n=1 Tax=Plectus sambesii TaxID=2011161 RepID=A0A914V9S3_9BILA
MGTGTTRRLSGLRLGFTDRDQLYDDFHPIRGQPSLLRRRRRDAHSLGGERRRHRRNYRGACGCSFRGVHIGGYQSSVGRWVRPTCRFHRFRRRPTVRARRPAASSCLTLLASHPPRELVRYSARRK